MHSSLFYISIKKYKFCQCYIPCVAEVLYSTDMFRMGDTLFSAVNVVMLGSDVGFSSPVNKLYFNVLGSG